MYIYNILCCNLYLYIGFLCVCVAEARAEIDGTQEKYLRLGSALRLVCTLRESTEPPLYVFWFHNSRMINYDNDRGVNVTTDRPSKTSTLWLASAAPEHTGNYTCAPSNAQSASTYVHILNGKQFYHLILSMFYLLFFHQQ